jgi:diguanylate cyclase
MMAALPDAIRQRLEQDPTLPTLPAVAERLVGLWTRVEQPAVRDVARVVAKDASIAAKLLRYANSAAFAVREPSRSVSHAVTMLGTRHVRNVVLSFALVSFARGKGVVYGAFWRRSVLASVFARELAALDEWTGLAAEESALAALLQDIGILALLSVIGGDYEVMVVQAATDHAALAKAERERFGVDHCDVGAWLLQRWMFPEYLTNAVALSHGPLDGGDNESGLMARLAAIAGVLADAWIEGGAPQTLKRTGEVAAFRATDPLKSALARAEIGIQEAAGMFNVELFDAPNIDWLLERARRIIAIHSS